MTSHSKSQDNNVAVRVRKQDRRLCLRRVCRLLPDVVVHLLGMSENGVSFVLTFLTPPPPTSNLPTL